MAQANITNIGFEELKNHQKLGTLIIDVREPEEIAETGVLPDGINVPLGEICAALSKAPHDFETKYGRKMPEKGDDIVFSCRSGKRSAQACSKAVELGFNRAKNFQGGWLEWEKQTKG
ncbi:thiosulfate sulfurtransferase/rhodanese-like domain-containing protein 3 isoform X2 [Rhodnius prolixus]